MANYEGSQFKDATEVTDINISDVAYSTPNTPYQKKFADEFGHNSHVYRHDAEGKATRVPESEAMLLATEETPAETTFTRKRTKHYVDNDGYEFSTLEEKRRAEDLRENWQVEKQFTFNGDTKRDDGIRKGTKVVQLRSVDDSSQTTLVSHEDAIRYGVVDNAEVLSQPFTYGGATVRKDGIKKGDRVERVRNVDGSTDIRKTTRRPEHQQSVAETDSEVTANDAELERGEDAISAPTTTQEEFDRKLASIDSVINQALHQAADSLSEFVGGLSDEQLADQAVLAKILTTKELLSDMQSRMNHEEDTQGSASPESETDAQEEQEMSEQELNGLDKWRQKAWKAANIPVMWACDKMSSTAESIARYKEKLESDKKAKAAFVIGGLAIAGAGAAWYFTRQGDTETANLVANAATGVDPGAGANALAADSAQAMAEQSQQHIDQIAAAREASEAARQSAVESASTVAAEAQDKIDAAREAAEAFANQPEFVIERGNGFTHEIVDFAQSLGKNLEGDKAYDIYEQIIDKFGKDGILLNTDTYEMANGDIGIGSPGIDKWAPGVADFIKARL